MLPLQSIPAGVLVTVPEFGTVGGVTVNKYCADPDPDPEVLLLELDPQPASSRQNTSDDNKSNNLRRFDIRRRNSPGALG